MVVGTLRVPRSRTLCREYRAVSTISTNSANSVNDPVVELWITIRNTNDDTGEDDQLMPFPVRSVICSPIHGQMVPAVIVGVASMVTYAAAADNEAWPRRCSQGKCRLLKEAEQYCEITRVLRDFFAQARPSWMS